MRAPVKQSNETFSLSACDRIFRYVKFGWFSRLIQPTKKILWHIDLIFFKSLLIFFYRLNGSERIKIQIDISNTLYKHIFFSLPLPFYHCISCECRFGCPPKHFLPLTLVEVKKASNNSGLRFTSKKQNLELNDHFVFIYKERRCCREELNLFKSTNRSDWYCNNFFLSA